MLISQIIHPDGSLGVVLREGSEAALVKGANSTYSLALKAASSGRSLAAVIAWRQNRRQKKSVCFNKEEKYEREKF